MRKQKTLMFIHQSENVGEELLTCLGGQGVTVRRAESLAEATPDTVDALLLGLEGFVEAGGDLTDVIGSRLTVPVIGLVRADNLSLGVAAVRAGAKDFVRVPLDAGELSYVITRVLGVPATERRMSSAAPPGCQGALLGGSRPMLELRGQAERAASSLATVLIQGESGTGKGLLARELHRWSARRDKPFVTIHCGAIPDTLLESELFGYERGAFSGAATSKPGRIDLAQGGTLFLDEIGDITPAVQVKLLRVLQERVYERLGSTRTLDANVRFVGATHQDLAHLVRLGRFREDLYYRFHVVRLTVPPLRARLQDIDELALHFCRASGEANGRPEVTFDADALEVLRSYEWPGNVRELENLVERLVVMALEPRITRHDVVRELRASVSSCDVLSSEAGWGQGMEAAHPRLGDGRPELQLATVLAEAERDAIRQALRRAGGNRSHAARLLGISRRSLYKKLQTHALQLSSSRPEFPASVAAKRL